MLPIPALECTALTGSPPAEARPGDLRLRDLHTLVDSGRYDLLSLDVFDTVVYRMVPTPTDAFLLVADRLRARGALYASSSRESFLRERVGAEERARRAKPSGEVTLDEIYQAFPRGYVRGISPSEVAEVEMEVEESLVRVHPEIRTLVAAARELGMKIAFVSDTYFTSSRIDRLVDLRVDYRLLSCEENLSKHQGLHRRLVERSGVEPGRILHVGNDYQADIKGPEIFGLDRYWFRVWPDAYRELLSRELPGTLSARAACLPAGDGGLTAMRSRAMFRAEGVYEEWGAGILGPLVTGFADWVAARCREEGIDLALCLMREGRILRQVLELTAGAPEARELYVSRYAARKAAIFEGTEEELKGFVFRPTPERRGRVTHQLGLAPDAVGDPDLVLSPEAVKDLIARIHADRSLRRQVVRSSAAARAGLLAHLDAQLEGWRGARVAVVDLGYKGTIQGCLERILAREGRDLRTHGLYLVTGGDVHETQGVGAPVEGWLAENGQPISMAHTFMRSPEIVEQSLMAPCGTTLGYTPKGEPILDEFRAPEAQREEIARIQQGILRFAREWSRHRGVEAIADPAARRKLYQAIAIGAVARPLPRELELFGHWRHDENFGSDLSRSLVEVEGLGAWEKDHLSAHQLASLPMSQVYWPFGFARLLSPSMGEAVAGIFLRAAAPEAFDAGHKEHALVAYWDTGHGFHAEEATLETYRLNNRGRVWRRFTLPVRNGRVPARRLGFSLGLRDQIVTLTGVALSGSGTGRDPSVRRLSPETLEMSGYRHLEQNLYLVTDDTPLIVVPLDDVEPGLKEIHVDLFFGLVLGGSA